MTALQDICPGLIRGTDGIWYAPGENDISYPPQGNDHCFSVEDSSFWFKHRNDCIIAVVKAFPPNRNEAFFDIGGGNGFVSGELSEAGFPSVLLEPGRAGALNAKKRGVMDVVCATTETAEIRKNSVGAFGMFDVLEHINKDAAFLQSLHPLLTPRGKLFLTVPAYPFLWSAEDVYAGHFRRYTIKSITTLLELSGFEIMYSSHFFRLLPIPILIFRALPFRLGLIKRNRSENIANDHTMPKSFMTNLFNKMLLKEVAAIRANKTIRYGGSCIIAAERNN